MYNYKNSPANKKLDLSQLLKSNTQQKATQEVFFKSNTSYKCD